MNSGNGTLFIDNSTVSVGFANALAPGSLSIGNVSVLANERANAFGVATFERVSLNVADRINVGGLEGNGINPLTATNGSVLFVDSLVSAPLVDIAVVLAGTAGTASGKLHLNPSLLNVSGPLTLGAGATLAFDLEGTTRADGTGEIGQYGAINAGSATIDGVLEILLADGFSPSSGDFFDLLSTTGTLSGTFSSVALPTLAPSLSWNLLQTTNLLRLEVQSVAFDGDFNGDLDIDGSDFLTWQRGFGISPNASKAQGDADSSGAVNQMDLAIWESTFGDTIPASIAVISTPVPEPKAVTLVILGMLWGSLRRRRRNVNRCLRLNMRVTEL